MSKSRNIADLGSNDVIETTASGVDVTGTVTADGLTVGNSSANADLVLSEGSTNTEARIRNTNGILEIDADLNNEFGNSSMVFAVDGTDKVKINNNGDVSFYEDTGTTAKFVWDASAESLGIGTASPSAPLEVNGGTQNIIQKLKSTDDGCYLQFNDDNALGYYMGVRGGNFAILNTDNSTKFHIDPTGNVGIGNASPETYDGVATTTALVVGGTAGNNGVNVVSGSTSTGSYMFSDSGGNDRGGFTYYHTADLMTINTGGSERARIDSSGNLLVGTTNDQGQAGKFVASGGSAVDGTRAITETICRGASGTFGTITISFTGNNSNTSGIMDVQLACYDNKGLDYCIMQYSSTNTVQMRSNKSSGLTVSVTGTPSSNDGNVWTMTIVGTMTHPVVTAKCTAGGLATGFATAPAISFS